MASNLTPGELAAILAGFNAYAANGPGGMALYKSPDGWTYYDARNSDEQGRIGGFIGRFETARFATGTHVPSDTFDPHDGRYLGPSSFDTTSPWWTNGMLPFVLVGAAFGAELLGLGSTTAGSVTAAGADGWELTNAAVMGGPGTDLAGITAAGTGATILPAAATTAGASTLTSTLTSAATKLGAGAVTTALTSALGGGARPGTQPTPTQPYTVTPAVQTAAQASNVGLGALVALGLGLLALKG